LNVIKSLFQVDGKKLWYRNNEAEPEKSCGIATLELPRKIAASNCCLERLHRLGRRSPWNGDAVRKMENLMPWDGAARGKTKSL
jgi:hypothetical protein